MPVEKHLLEHAPFWQDVFFGIPGVVNDVRIACADEDSLVYRSRSFIAEDGEVVVSAGSSCHPL